MLCRKYAQVQSQWLVPSTIRVRLPSDDIVLDILMSRVSEAQSQFKRCCIAFADMCCTKSRTAEGCCESICDGYDDLISPLLSKAPYQLGYNVDKNEKLESEDVGSQPATTAVGVREDIILEVIGMDCPDCLSKVTRAVQVLSGAEVTNADGVRGLVNVKYDPSEYKAIITIRMAYSIP